MASLWGTKKDDPDRHSRDHDEYDNEQNRNQNHNDLTSEEPTERTSLLPREDSHHFLSPDDPAVCIFLSPTFTYY